MALAADGRINDALEIWLTMVREDRTFLDDGARKAMLMAFEVLGLGSPESNAWRSRLASVLY
jgi:putative thioredoxin